MNNNIDGKRLKKVVRIILFILLPAFLLGAAAASVGYVYLIHKISDANIYLSKLLQDSPYPIPSRIYAQNLVLRPGMALSQDDLAAMLDSMDYQNVEALTQPGEYVAGKNRIEIWVMDEDLEEDGHDLSLLSLQWKNNSLSQINDRQNERSLENIVFKPLWLDAVYDSSMEDRVPIKIDDVPQHFLDILLFSEDRNFYQHKGYDVWGIARAMTANVRKNKLSQGASTITQQLVRSLALHRRREFDRKINEVLLAFELERTLSKEQILEHYLNTCYFGQSGSVNICGVALAAKYYFNASPPKLTIAQSAALAAMIPAPNLFNPFPQPRGIIGPEKCFAGQVMQEPGDLAGRSQRSGSSASPGKAASHQAFVSERRLFSLSASSRGHAQHGFQRRRMPN
ncbi:MAG: transglycosylase domain-containing protein [Candidatus Omnitrophica bacterium]|nr:transglycosylase domain-containing protein [Candidatus Omnitrophota bacterium]